MSHAHSLLLLGAIQSGSQSVTVTGSTSVALITSEVATRTPLASAVGLATNSFLKSISNLATAVSAYVASSALTQNPLGKALSSLVASSLRVGSGTAQAISSRIASSVRAATGQASTSVSAITHESGAEFNLARAVALIRASSRILVSALAKAVDPSTLGSETLNITERAHTSSGFFVTGEKIATSLARTRITVTAQHGQGKPPAKKVKLPLSASALSRANVVSQNPVNASKSIAVVARTGVILQQGQNINVSVDAAGFIGVAGPVSALRNVRDVAKATVSVKPEIPIGPSASTTTIISIIVTNPSPSSGNTAVTAVAGAGVSLVAADFIPPPPQLAPSNSHASTIITIVVNNPPIFGGNTAGQGIAEAAVSIEVEVPPDNRDTERTSRARTTIAVIATNEPEISGSTLATEIAAATVLVRRVGRLAPKQVLLKVRDRNPILKVKRVEVAERE